MLRNRLAVSLFLLTMGCAHPGLRGKKPAPDAIAPGGAIASRPAMPCSDEDRLRDDANCAPSEDEAPASEPLALGGLQYSTQRLSVGGRWVEVDGLGNVYRGGERSGVANPSSQPS